jgi:hypothetical protein
MQLEGFLKNYIHHFLSLTMTVFGLVLSISCSSDNRLTTTSSENQLQSQQISGTVEFVNPSDGKSYQNFSVLQGDTVNIAFKFTQDEAQNYEIGYARKDPKITLNRDSINVNSATTGTHTLTLIARKKALCRQALTVRCDITQKKVPDYYPTMDIKSSVTVNILDRAMAGSNRPQGLLEDVIKGQGLLGGLAQAFFGDQINSFSNGIPGQNTGGGAPPPQ